MKVAPKIPQFQPTKAQDVIGSAAPAKTNLSFKSLYDAIANKQSLSGLTLDAPLTEIMKIRKTLELSKEILPKDMLMYQLQISELNMRVELLSKAADSAVALTRKLQNAQ